MKYWLDAMGNGQWGERSAYSEEIDKWVESTNIEPSNEFFL